jgi:hypothetical protein
MRFLALIQRHRWNQIRTVKAYEEAYDFIESQKEIYEKSKWVKANEILTQNLPSIQPGAQPGIRKGPVFMQTAREAPHFGQPSHMMAFLEGHPDELKCYTDFLSLFVELYDPKARPFELDRMLELCLHPNSINKAPPYLRKDFERIASFVKKYYQANYLTEEQIHDQLGELFPNLQQSKLNPIEKAAYAHIRIVEIHPFMDGNGRTARLLQNTILKEAGCPPVPVGKNYNEAVKLSLDNKYFTIYKNYICSMIDIKWTCLQAADGIER